MWEYICPKCRKEVKVNSHECLHCGEKFPLAIKVPPTFLKDPKKLEFYVHKHVFPRVSEFERNYLTKYFTTIFSDGFESGDFNAWTGTHQAANGALSVETLHPNSGTYNAKFTVTDLQVDDVNCYYTLSSPSVAYMRAYVQVATALPSSGNYFTTIEFDNLGFTSINKAIVYNNGSAVVWAMRLKVNGNAIIYQSSVPVSLNSYYCVELYTKVDASAGAGTLYINGNNVASASGVETDNQGANQQAIVGSPQASDGDPATTHTIYVDDVVVADAYIGPISTTTNVSISDSVCVSDSVLCNKTLALTDSVGAVDAFGLFDPAIFDPAFFGTTAIVTLYVNKTLKLADSSSLSDAILRNKTLTVFDAVLLSDLVNVITEAIVKTVLDVVGLADQALMNKPVAIADTVGIVEAIFRHKPSVTVADVVAVAEAVLVSKLLMVADSVSLADVLCVLKTLHVSDALSLVDAVGLPSRVLCALDAVSLADGAFVSKALQVTDAICLVEVVWAGKRRETALYLIVGNLMVNLKTGKVDFAL